MRLKFFWIPARDSSAAEIELNAFLARSRVVQVEKAVAAYDCGSGWGPALDCGEFGDFKTLAVPAARRGARRILNADPVAALAPSGRACHRPFSLSPPGCRNKPVDDFPRLFE